MRLQVLVQLDEALRLLLHVLELILLQLGLVVEPLVLRLDVPLDLRYVLLSIALCRLLEVLELLVIALVDLCLHGLHLVLALLLQVLQLPLQLLESLHFSAQVLLSLLLGVFELVEGAEFAFEILHLVLFLVHEIIVLASHLVNFSLEFALHVLLHGS